MKHKIIILPRFAFIQLLEIDILKHNVAVISISSVGDSIENINYKNVLQVEFNDDLQSFDEQHAILIKEFADKNVDCPYFIVHCDAGVSRSGAIGTWLVKYFGDDMDIFREINPYIAPNTYILNVMKSI